MKKTKKEEKWIDALQDHSAGMLYMDLRNALKILGEKAVAMIYQQAKQDHK